jgi:uncharacterized membrane protein
MEKKVLNMKGQMSVYGVIYGFIALLAVVMFAPGFYSLITSVSGNATANNDFMTPMVMNMVVPMFAIGVLMIPVVYTLAGRGNQEGQ